MDQELLTLINNMKSQMEQLSQIIEGEGSTEEPEAEEPVGDEDAVMMQKVLKMLKEDEEEEVESPEEEEVEKDTKEEVDAVNADDDAEDRAEDLPGETEENIAEVAKAVVRQLRKNRAIKKKKAVPQAKLTKALVVLARRLAHIEKAQENIIEGMGLAEQVMKVNKPEPRQIRSDHEVNKSVDQIRQLLGIAKEEKPQTGTFDLHKALTENDGVALKSMLSVRNKAR